MMFWRLQVENASLVIVHILSSKTNATIKNNSYIPTLKVPLFHKFSILENIDISIICLHFGYGSKYII